jgi:hypothetical protein
MKYIVTLQATKEFEVEIDYTLFDDESEAREAAIDEAYDLARESFDNDWNVLGVEKE